MTARLPLFSISRIVRREDNRLKLGSLAGILLLLQLSQLSLASDWLREKRMADEIVDVILDGEVTMLKSGEREFLGIYTEADASDKAVIVMHGRGFHPDWVDTVQPLRVGLVDYGWNTLSIQMPVLAKDAKYYDYVPIFDEAIPRIQSAIEYLKEQGNQQIVMVAHSCSVHMSMHYFSKQGDEELLAYVGIGMGATDYKQPMAKPFPLDKLTVPVLDIYGADDYPAVHRLAPGRWLQIQQAGHELSKQLVIANSDHYFTDQDDALVHAVSDWLNQLDTE